MRRDQDTQLAARIRHARGERGEVGDGIAIGHDAEIQLACVRSPSAARALRAAHDPAPRDFLRLAFLGDVLGSPFHGALVAGRPWQRHRGRPLARGGTGLTARRRPGWRRARPSGLAVGQEDQGEPYGHPGQDDDGHDDQLQR